MRCILFIAFWMFSGFANAQYYLKVSYVVTNNPLMFSNPSSAAENFRTYRKNIACFISSQTVEQSIKE